MEADSVLIYNKELLPIRFPWAQGLSFRTYTSNCRLMSVLLDNGQTSDISIVNGAIVYNTQGLTVRLEASKVNDGKWHHVKVGLLDI